MKPQPTLETDRLLLRPLMLSDAGRIQLLAGDYRIARMTGNIPHPYEDGLAETWLQTLPAAWTAQTQAGFAVCLKDRNEQIGCCGLNLVMEHKRASLGYWVGVDYWNAGYCTEAATAAVAFGFEEMALRRIEAQHLTKNPASGRVMQKIGMTHEARMRDYVVKDGRHEDMELYAVLA